MAAIAVVGSELSKALIDAGVIPPNCKAVWMAGNVDGVWTAGCEVFVDHATSEKLATIIREHPEELRAFARSITFSDDIGTVVKVEL